MSQILKNRQTQIENCESSSTNLVDSRIEVRIHKDGAVRSSHIPMTFLRRIVPGNPHSQMYCFRVSDTLHMDFCNPCCCCRKHLVKFVGPSCSMTKACADSDVDGFAVYSLHCSRHVAEID